MNTQHLSRVREHTPTVQRSHHIRLAAPPGEADILRLVVTIKLKEATASDIFRRLNSYSKQNTLYTALKAFGRIVKTLFILRYIDDVALRMAIEAQLNQVELANRFTRAVAVGNPREFAYAHQDDQQIAEACNRLIKNAIICWNYLYLEMRDLFRADSDLIMERVEWSILNHPAQLTEAEMSFRASENVIEIDIEGEKLVYSQTQQVQAPLPGFIEPDEVSIEASFVRWLEGQCRAADIPQTDMTAWLARLVSWLVAERGLPIRTLIDWQYPLATRTAAKIAEIRATVRASAVQTVLFEPGAVLGTDPSCVARFDAESYANVATTPTGAFRLRRHLLGADRVPLLDGDPGGDEFQCAWSLDSMEEVDLWVRNLPKHPASFWIPRAKGRFYPDFIARLKDGRIFVVEYKGEHLVTALEAREKNLLGHLWAQQTGNLFLMVRKMQHGVDALGQMQAVVTAG